MKDSCPPVPPFLPDSTALRGSASDAVGLCRGSCGEREERYEGQRPGGVISPGPKCVGGLEDSLAPPGACFLGVSQRSLWPLETHLGSGEGLGLGGIYSGLCPIRGHSSTLS